MDINKIRKPDEVAKFFYEELNTYVDVDFLPVPIAGEETRYQQEFSIRESTNQIWEERRQSPKFVDFFSLRKLLFKRFRNEKFILSTCIGVDETDDLVKLMNTEISRYQHDILEKIVTVQQLM